MLWAQSTTKDCIRAEHKFHCISKLFISEVIIPQVIFLTYIYSVGTQHGNLHPAGWPILFCGSAQEPSVSHSQHRKNRKRFWKNAGEWTPRVEIDKEEIPGSMRSMYAYWPIPGFKGRTFKLCVLTRWDFNFCVRSSPLRRSDRDGSAADDTTYNFSPYD